MSILTIREGTAQRVKELAKARGLAIDEPINELISPSGSLGWSICNICGAKVKTNNLHERMIKVHPRTAT